MPPPVERDRPVFVVGPSRSGTSMLRESLNRGGRIWIARETHWFDDLRTTLPTGRLDGADAARCRDYFLRLAHRAYGAEADRGAATIDPAELAAEAASLGGSGDAWFAAFCRLRARANGRGRWGEKTPRHAFRIDELLAAFPSARVVCLIRDPRAVVASYRDWTTRAALSPDRGGAFAGDRTRARRSYDPVLASLLWRSATEAGCAAARRHGPAKVRLQRFEALVERPAEELAELCAWLELEFDPAMLDVPLVQSSYDGAPGETGISAAPATRWRTKLSPVEVAVVQRSCGASMRRLGYVPEPVEVPRREELRAWLRAPLGLARAWAANRGRMGRAGRYVARRLRFAVS